MKIIEDKAQKRGLHAIKHNRFKQLGVELLEYPLPCGDYILVNDKVQDLLDRKAKRGIEPKKMDFLGTYTKVVDTKQDIQELISDICGKQHERFRDECILAKNNGIKLYILVENRGQTVNEKKGVVNPTITNVRELHKWVNPRLWISRNGKQLYPTATKGITLQRACLTMQEKYGVRFLFCTPEESADKIIELLEEK